MSRCKSVCSKPDLAIVLCLEGLWPDLLIILTRKLSNWCLFWFMTKCRCYPGWPQTPKLNDILLQTPRQHAVHGSAYLMVSYCYSFSLSLFNKMASLAMLSNLNPGLKFFHFIFLGARTLLSVPCTPDSHLVLSHVLFSNTCEFET